MTDQTYSERILRLAYEGASESYGAISGFRAKLLALLPLATGAGAFLLLERAENDKVREFLGPIGIFGFVVTLGLFFYELRGVQRCQRLEVQLCTLEKQFGLSKDQGPFLGQPPRRARQHARSTSGRVDRLLRHRVDLARVGRLRVPLVGAHFP